MLVHDLLSRAAARTPDALAVIETAGSRTYAALEADARRVAALLCSSGVGPGDRVVLALDNSIEFIACYFGILNTGAVAVPLPAGPRSDRLTRAVRDCSPAACIVDDATWPLISAGAGTASIRARFVLPRRGVFHAGDGDVSARDLRTAMSEAADDVELRRVTETDLAAIIYTSGSTGDPRGVMLSHRNICANTASIVQYLELNAGDRVMVVLPFYYVYGLSLLHTHLAAGGTVVIDNRFAFPNVVLSGMQAHAVTGFAGVPSTFAMLLHRSKLAGTPLPSLRYVTQAGGAMPTAHLQEWLKVLPGVPFFIMYGATEAAARLAYLPPAELLRRPGSIGRAIPGVELRVLREDGSVAGVTEVGEIVASGANISSGYWNCPEETAERFGPEGYRTGDLGYADSDGFLYLVGRKHDMIKIGAHRVSAKEIEEALHEHPAVHEAAVVSRPHEILGEAPVAHVVLREAGQASGLDIIKFCRTRLAEHKVPVAVEFHAHLPKSGAGKIVKGALLAAACAGSDRQR
jgi:long-chain acyl-CoA synthetase